MKRTVANMMIDAAAFAGFVVLVTTGLLLRYRLPPGSGRVLGGGTGRGAMQRDVSLVWGLSRHEWGDIHFYLSVGILAVLAFHIVLHWKWIVSVVRGRRREGSPWRLALGVLSLAAVVLLGAAPLVSPPTRIARQHFATAPAAGDHFEAAPAHQSIRGGMSLRELEIATGVPPDCVLDCLGMPRDTSLDEQLGRLARTYGFTMHDIRRSVAICQPPD